MQIIIQAVLSQCQKCQNIHKKQWIVLEDIFH